MTHTVLYLIPHTPQDEALLRQELTGTPINQIVCPNTDIATKIAHVVNSINPPLMDHGIIFQDYLIHEGEEEKSHLRDRVAKMMNFVGCRKGATVVIIADPVLISLFCSIEAMLSGATKREARNIEKFSTASARIIKMELH